jgi:hypothetical protein
VFGILTVRHNIPLRLRLLLLLLPLGCCTCSCALPLPPLPAHLLVPTFASNCLSLLSSLLTCT